MPPSPGWCQIKKGQHHVSLHLNRVLSLTDVKLILRETSSSYCASKRAHAHTHPYHRTQVSSFNYVGAEGQFAYHGYTTFDIGFGYNK